MGRAVATERSARRMESLAARSREPSADLAAQLEARRGLSPAPGDLFLLPAAADLPVEWAVLDRRPGAAGEVLTVLADTCPLVGSADVAVPAGAPGGPLSLRCGFGLWLPAAAFDPALRTGLLAQDAVAEGLARWRRIEAGHVTGSPLAEEVDADPEYQDWIREVLRPARTLATSRPRAAGGPRIRRWGAAQRLAAALALVALGLSFRVVQLRREVARLSGPVFGIPIEDVVLGGGTRGSEVLRLPRDAGQVVLMLIVESSLASGEGYLEIARKSGELIWRSRRLRLAPGDDFPLMLWREALPDGEYRFRIVPEAGAAPVVEEVLRIESEP